MGDGSTVQRQVRWASLDGSCGLVEQGLLAVLLRGQRLWAHGLDPQHHHFYGW